MEGKRHLQTEILLRIVKTWRIQEKSEYRGFRCANCQKYLHKAYYYWLDGGGYKTPVHFCQKCQKKFEAGKIEITKPPFEVNRKTFGLDFGKDFLQLCKEIIKKWKTKDKPEYKIFTCDKCGKNVYKAWHVWLNLNDYLAEFHFCKSCGNKLKLSDEK